MNLLEGILKDTLFIDFGVDPVYGSDQMYIDFPRNFATVSFQLMDTATLSQIVDRIRVEKHEDLKPMNPMDEFTDEMCDQDGWYDFYLSINEINESRVDSCIEAVVVSNNAPDNEEVYTIYLNDREQEAVFTRLDEQCREYLGKGCIDLLAEARKRMEEET